MPGKSDKKVMGGFFKFVAANPTAAHVTANSARMLEKAGFTRLYEADAWNLKKGFAGYVIRGGGSLVAFRIGDRPVEKAGFRIVGAHSDSPGLRVKPNGPYNSEGYLMLGVEIYGGPLFASWTDRDLSLAGKIVLEKEGKPHIELVDVKRPVCRIPQLAIHMNRDANKKGLTLNAQKHLPPVLGLTDKKDGSKRLANLLAAAANVKATDILDFTLDLYDTQPPCTAGIDNEFYFSGRIDNQSGCYSALLAIMEVKKSPATDIVALFDHEEIGSSTYTGAGSNLLDTVMERICLGGENPRERLLRAVSNSIQVSSDGAHALHPNYIDKHDKHHRPILNKGPVVKVHAKKKWATNTITKAHFESCAKKAGIPYQVVVNRSDMLSGSTIGPISSTRTGLPTVDVGIPMLSMHSVREMAGMDDMAYMKRALVEHFRSS